MVMVEWGDVVTYLCRSPLSPGPQVQPETDSTSPLISVQLPLSLQHTYMHAHIYKYVYIYIYMYTQCTNELPTWTPWACCSTDSTAGLLNGPWINIWWLTWQTLNFLLFLIFITHHMGPTVTFDSVFILELEMTTQAGVNLWHYSVPIELKRKLSGDDNSWKLGLQWKPFWPSGSGQQIIVGGDWEVNKQQVSQQYWTMDMVSSWRRGGKRRVSDCGR